MEIPCVRAVLCARDAMQACKDKVGLRHTHALAAGVAPILVSSLEELCTVSIIVQLVPHPSSIEKKLV